MAEVHALSAHSDVPDLVDGSAGEQAFGLRLAGAVDSAYRLAAVILGDAADAEDATHDALERAWRAKGKLRDANRFDAWFSRILVNSCRDRIRIRRKMDALVSLDAASPRENVLQPAGRDPFEAELRRDSLASALGTLPIDQRIVIALRYYLDLEVDEIARRLGTRPGTVKSRLHRGLSELKAAWDAGERETH